MATYRQGFISFYGLLDTKSPAGTMQEPAGLIVLYLENLRRFLGERLGRQLEERIRRVASAGDMRQEAHASEATDHTSVEIGASELPLLEPGAQGRQRLAVAVSHRIRLTTAELRVVDQRLGRTSIRDPTRATVADHLQRVKRDRRLRRTGNHRFRGLGLRGSLRLRDNLGLLFGGGGRLGRDHFGFGFAHLLHCAS